MIFSGLIMGSVLKLGVNVVNTLMANSAEEKKNNALRDAEVVHAHVELAKTVSNDPLTKIIRGTIFLMLVGTWCYMAIYGLYHPDMKFDVLVPKENHWAVSNLWSRGGWQKISISGSILMFQWFQIMEMVVGFFVVPSRKR